MHYVHQLAALLGPRLGSTATHDEHELGPLLCMRNRSPGAARHEQAGTAPAYLAEPNIMSSRCAPV